MNSVPSRCDACGSTLRPGAVGWHVVCSDCGLESSTLSPEIGETGPDGRIDELKREQALQPVRDANFDSILEWMRLHVGQAPGSPGRPRLLDVGCAHGWFLAKASAHFQVTGIEPDPATAVLARMRCDDVRQGFFPDILEDGEMFDVIVFNDVLEHIPHVVDVLRACRKRLAANGLLVVNAPDSRGALYRLARLLHSASIAGPFERMWQLGMPSPHLYYFDATSLSRAAKAAGFQLTHERRLPAVRLKGLYSRIRFDRATSPLAAALLYVGVVVLSPLLRVAPPDISVWFLAPGREPVR